MLILLDIDGVMVPANSWKKPEFHEDGFPMFNSRSVRALQKIISETGASLLLTTSHKSRYNIAQWRNIFKSRGINVKHIHRLASTSLHSSRKDEILKWYTAKHIPNEQFVIIDDDKLLNELPYHLKNNLILTSPSVGLTEELAENAISILNNRAYNYA
ncbi:MAG TPA: HAD domain-containing protein [Mucilaginibacter sp.]